MIMGRLYFEEGGVFFVQGVVVVGFQGVGLDLVLFLGK